MAWTYSDVVQSTSGAAIVGASCTMWTARTGGTQVTSLTTIGGASISAVTSGAGGLIEWKETTEAYPILWVQPPSGARRYVAAADAMALLGTAIDDAADASAAATAATATAGAASVAAAEALATADAAAALAELAYGGSQFVTAADYGIDPLSSDNSAALQSALIAGAGKTVLIPPGDWTINAKIYVPDGTTVWGYGATIHRGVSPTASIVTNYPTGDTTTTAYNGAGDITLLGLTFDSHGDDVGRVAGNLVAFVHCKNITVRDCTFRRPKGFHALELNAVDGALVDGCRFLGYVSDGLTWKEAVQIDVAVSGSVPSGATDNTLAKNITVRDCHFDADEYGNPAPQVAVGSHTTYSTSRYQGIEVIGCTGSATTAFVRGYYWDHPRIVACQSTGGQYGYRMEQTIGAQVIGSDAVSPTVNGVHFTNSSQRCKVIGGSITQPANGVSIADGATDCGALGVTVYRPQSGSGTGYGVVFDAAVDGYARDCLIVGAGYPSGASGAIRVSDASGASVRTSISGCKTVLHGAGTEVSAGVSVAAGSTDTWVFGCDFKGLAAATSGTVNTTSNRI